MRTKVVKNYISRLVFLFLVIDKFSLSILHKIPEQKKGKRFSFEGKQ